MERNFLAFCQRQSTKMIEYAVNCTDPALKDEFLKMSAYWLKASKVKNKSDEAAAPQLVQRTEQSTRFQGKDVVAQHFYRRRDEVGTPAPGNSGQLEHVINLCIEFTSRDGISAEISHFNAVDPEFRRT